MTSRVTMRDVARAAEVSPMTVSRALRNDTVVNDATRQRIRQVADSLGYVYDTTARALRMQKSGFIAVTLPSINNANFADTFRSLTNGLAASGVQLLLGSTNYRVQREEDLVRELLTRNPEALILTGGYHSTGLRAVLEQRGLPVIETWDLPERPLGHVVGFSNAEAMAGVVRAMARQGRRKLAFVGATEGSDFRGMARRAGAVQAARTLGLPPITQINAGPAPVTMQAGLVAVEAMSHEVAKFDALVCVSDPVAFGCLNACLRMGLRVPDDIAITGFGNFDVARVSTPTITTVDVRAAEIGARTASLLLSLFESDLELEPQRVDVGTRLILGDTT